LAVLSELDVLIIADLKAGRIVRLPNGTRFEPIGKKDGYINIRVNGSPELDRIVNSSFREKWLNAENIGMTEAKMIVIWNTNHQDDPLPLD
jgi:hypothetical protein